MDKIIIEGGRKLSGSVRVSGAKNAVLPLMAAAILVDGACEIHETPWLTDVKVMCDVLNYLGVDTDFASGTLNIDASRLQGITAPYEYVQKMRASFLVMGPLLARLGRAKVSLPGGCPIGSRPIDLHLKGFEAMGANITIGNGFIDAKADQLYGSRIYLDFPSVGATENLMMAATLAEGNTVLENVAEEPEIVDLANFLNAMGAKIKGAGTNVIRIEGVTDLKPVSHVVIPDRIEAGSFMLMAAMTQSELLVENVISQHLKSVIAKMEEAGITVIEEDDGILVKACAEIMPVDIKTMPHPGFPTDMQAQFMALLSIAKGTSVITETVFENRFMHVDELSRMSADLKIEGNSVVVKGVPNLCGADVKATDLRAGAALVMAGLGAQGITKITAVDHIHRGYENFVNKLQSIGAAVSYE
ncbi:MAG: UDP-N-acetylglucosamine 1-carboxyvinyltransferase [Clostridia bacterium]|nr:UDP-N-acetylglucosamine 1-carboxyvinyltransferase [Clostridia bacterium]